MRPSRITGSQSERAWVAGVASFGSVFMVTGFNLWVALIMAVLASMSQVLGDVIWFLVIPRMQKWWARRRRPPEADDWKV